MDSFKGKSSKDFQQFGGRFCSQQPDILEAADRADKALGLSVKERMGLVVCVESDDGEDDESDEDVSMDVESK